MNAAVCGESEPFFLEAVVHAALGRVRRVPAGSPVTDRRARDLEGDL